MVLLFVVCLHMTLSWGRIFAEVQALTQPNSFSDAESPVGPKPHPQPSQTTTVGGSGAVRAEGCGVIPLASRELPGHALGGETLRKTSFNAYRKRCWLRAVRRAMTYGKVCYHGFWLRKNQISLEDQHQAMKLRPLTCSRQRRPTGTDPTKKVSGKPVSSTQVLKYFSWNCGGLPTAKYDEVMLWADQNQFTMVALQETRRKHSCCWTSGNFHVIQSGDSVPHGSSYAGILLAVHKTVQLSFKEVIPGRLLHARLDGLKRAPPHNVLVVYNRPLPVGGTARAFAEALEVRAQLWQALDQTLSSIPARQSVLILGDFNCHLSRLSPHIPSGDPSHATSFDMEELQELLVRNSLCLLNMDARQHAVTFPTGIRAGVGTRIDYVLSRLEMRCCASSVRPSWTSPFQHASAAGWHAVLAGHFRLRSQLDHDCIRAAQSVEDIQGQVFCAQVRDSLAQKQFCHLHGNDALAVLSSTVLGVGQKVFGVSKKGSRPPPWCNTLVRTYCIAKWTTYRCLRSLPCPKVLADYLGVWRAVALRLCAQKTYRRQCRLARQSWIDEVCNEAKLAYINKHHSLFSHIRKLAPKKARHSLGIRRMLYNEHSLQEEGQAFYKHYSDLFRARTLDDANSNQTSWAWTKVPQCDDLEPHLSRIPLFKAVPKGQAWGSLWRLALRVPAVRDGISQLLSDMPSLGLPRQFVDGELYLLHKAGRKGDDVSHYRPLVLQCALGKTVLKWAASWLLSCVRSLVYRHPQFPYLGGRSAEMATHRASSFLTWRRSLAGHPIVPIRWQH